MWPFAGKGVCLHRGGKQELTRRIACYLDTGDVLPPSAPKGKPAPAVRKITGDMPIEPDIVCSEVHRAFFVEKIGRSFTFNVPFQKWLRENAGKTYGDAVLAYSRILADRKKSRTEIGSQFEYNAYIRAFFEDNPGRSLSSAIACWKYKKSLPGHNRYEPADLVALTECTSREGSAISPANGEKEDKP